MPVIAGLLLLYVPTFYHQATSYWNRDDYAHGPIFLLVVLWLIWDKRQILAAASAKGAPVAGLGSLILGLLIYMVGRSQGVAILETGALIPILAGVLLAMRGWPALRAYWFMLFFIVYLVPLPGFFVNAVTLPLKQNVSAMAVDILYLASYPVAHDGVLISIGQYQLLVSDACSGLNSMFSLTALGLLYLYLMRYRNWVHVGLILASLLPIAFFANVVRVIILVLVTYHFGDAAGQGFVHDFSGMLLFVIALAAILLLDAVLARILRRNASSS
jgi:exosortase B